MGAELLDAALAIEHSVAGFEVRNTPTLLLLAHMTVALTPHFGLIGQDDPSAGARDHDLGTHVIDLGLPVRALVPACTGVHLGRVLRHGQTGDSHERYNHNGCDADGDHGVCGYPNQLLALHSGTISCAHSSFTACQPPSRKAAL